MKRKVYRGIRNNLYKSSFFHRFDKISKPIVNDIKNTFIKFKSLSNLKHEKIFIERDYSVYNLKRDLLKYKEERI